MKLYWAPRTRSARGLWILEEAGIDYDLELVTLGDTGRETPEEFREASPMGKVPALVDGDVRMSESSAICLYIADRYSPGNLAPAIDRDNAYVVSALVVNEAVLPHVFASIDSADFRPGIEAAYTNASIVYGDIDRQAMGSLLRSLGVTRL